MTFPNAREFFQSFENIYNMAAGFPQGEQSYSKNRDESVMLFFFFFFYLFFALLGLHCCSRAFSCYSELRLLFIVVHGLLVALASLVAEHTL